MGDFYDSTYANFAAEVYGEVRAEAFGEDLGQNSWLTADELRRFAEWSHIGPDTRVLDVGCGSGGPAVRLAEQTGCSVHGIDIHGGGIAQANATAVRAGLDDRVHFDTLDANKPLPFPSASFDVVMCIDTVNHFADRAAMLAEWVRLLRPSGRILYTDPIVVTGALSHREIAVRSAIGFFLFVPPGENERRIREAGLELITAEDATINVAAVAGRWLAARAARQKPLRELEGDDGYHDTQEFLTMVELLARQRRLSRFVFVAERPAGS